MSKSDARLVARKPLALAAVFASSVAAVAAGSAANATTYGATTSPVTVTNGNTVSIVGGGTVSLPAGAHDVSWAGQGGRLAFIGADNGVYTADYDGSHVIQIATPASATGTRSHTVWDSYNHFILWSENGTIVQALANGNYVTWNRNPISIFDTGTSNVTGGDKISWADVAADFDNTTVFQTTSASGAVGVGTESYPNNGTTQTYTQVVADAAGAVDAQPTISPDGTRIVFVKKDAAGDKQLFLTTRSGTTWGAPVQVTFDPKVDHTAPIFEVDGKTVAYSSKDNTTPVPPTPMTGTYTVDVTAATASSNVVKQISAAVGGIAVRTDSSAYVSRFAGSTRFQTAVLASQHLWADATPSATDYRAKAQTVTLSRSDLFADALGGAGLAAHNNGPLLLTSTAGLSPETAAEITRILPKGSKVFLLGGTTAISPAVDSQLQAMGYTTDRVAGATRFDTAVAIANRVAPNPTDILVATGQNFPDALSAGAVSAAHPGTVVVLTADKTMPAATMSYLQHFNTNFDQNSPIAMTAVGGQALAAIDSTNAGFWRIPLVGNDRYQTSYMVAKEFFGVMNSAGVATGFNWPDALSGGAFMGRTHGPLLLVDPHVGLTQQENDMIDANRGSANYGYVFGGLAVLPGMIDGQLDVDVQTAMGVINH